MTDITHNITRHEVACKCGCGFDSLDYQTAVYVQTACAHFAIKRGLYRSVLLISSGCRCMAWNDHEGGQEGSKHLRASALDHHIVDVTPRELYDYYDKKYKGKFGVGLYKTFVHFDTRSDGPARW
jgi:uncharacterized protein YcbK (DUF882 family)